MVSEKSESGRLEALFVALMFLILGLGVVALGAKGWMPSLASRHGGGIDLMLHYLLWATGGLLLVGHAVLAFFVFRFATQRTVTYRLASPKVERAWSLALGLVMTIVAEGGVLAIGLPVFQEYFVRQPPPEAVTVEVTGEQFAWNVRYPGADGVFGRTEVSLINVNNPLGIDPADPAAKDDIVELNNVYLEVNRAAKFILRSKDVLHSFFLPHFRVKQDLVPGMRIPIWFVPTTEGRFEIVCAELCGLAHYRMAGFVHVLSPQEFDDWEREKKESVAAAAAAASAR